MKTSMNKRSSRLLSILLCAALLLTLLPAAALAADPPPGEGGGQQEAADTFKYLDDDGQEPWTWASDSIYSARTKGYMSGEQSGDGYNFRAGDSLTRAEAAVIALNVMGIEVDETVTESGFEDANDAWYTPYVAAAKEAGIVHGETATTFVPENPVTRAEFVTMVLTAKGATVDETVTASGFSDADGDWYTANVAAAKKAGLTIGDGTGKFHPNSYITRAEAATMLTSTSFVYVPYYDESNVMTAVGNEILFFGDIHDYENDFFYYNKETGETKGVFTYLKNNNLYPGLYVCIGDYLQRSHDITESDGVFAHCNKYIRDYAGYDIPFVSIMGNHEFDTAAADGMTGESVFEKTVGCNNYGLVARGVDENDPDQTIYYLVNFGCAHVNEVDEANTRANATNKYWVNPDQIEELDKTLSEIYGENGERNVGVPTFINAHLPIHYYTDERCALNNDMLLDVLNKYPYVIYVWGHNHSEKDPYYGTIKLPGDTIAPVKGIDTIGYDGTVAAKEINFTYVPCGVVRGNQISDNAEENSERALYVTVNGSEVSFTYCDRNGEVFDRMTYDVLDATYFEDFDTLDAANAANLTIDISADADMTKVQCADFFLDRPIAGNTPSTVKEYSGRYETTIAWKDADGNAVTDAFAYGNTYTAELTLTGDVDFSTLTGDNVFLFRLDGTTMPARYVTSKTVTATEGGAVIDVTFTATATIADTAIEAAAEITEGTQYAICSETEQYLYTISRADCVVEDGKLVSVPNTTATWSLEATEGGYYLRSSNGKYLTAGVNGPHTVLTPVADLADGTNTVWTFTDGALHIAVNGNDFCLTCVDGTFALTNDPTGAVSLYPVG